MKLGGAPAFSPEDYPDTEEPLLQRLTESFDEVYAAGRGTPHREYASGSFMTEPSGVTTLKLKNPLPQKPRHLNVCVRRDDLADLSAAFSWWWSMSGESVTIKFVSLPVSTRHVYSVEFT